MLSWLKDHFIPHAGNDHHPHLLRTEALVVFLGVALFAEISFLILTLIVSPQSNFLALIFPQALVQAANSDRSTGGVLALTVNPLLEQAATLKAQDMAEKSYFAHTSPQGVTPWYWLGKVGYQYKTAGENLAVNFLDSGDVNTAWMNSPSHRANIMNSEYTEIGIATSQGMYEGHETTFVVQFFGKPTSRPVVGISRTSAATPAPVPAPIFPVVKQVHAAGPVLSTIVAQPRKTTNYVFWIIGGLIVVALSLMIIMRNALPHPRLVLKPMLVLLVILSLVVLNRYIGMAHAAVF